MNIHVYSANIHKVDLEAGDEIGIVDGKFWVGSATIGNYQMKSGWISIPASANEGRGASVNGFTIGNAIGLQLYHGDKSYSLEMEPLAGAKSFEKNGSVLIKVSTGYLPVIQRDNGSDWFRCYPNQFKEELTIEIRNAE